MVSQQLQLLKLRVCLGFPFPELLIHHNNILYLTFSANRFLGPFKVFIILNTTQPDTLC